MESPIRSIQQQELLVQMGWVKRIAGGLLTDDHTAEDIAQSTWLLALQRPPRTAPSSPSFRAWLSGVTRRLALDRVRSDRGRKEREHRAARGGEIGSAFEIVERNAIQNHVSQAVMKLDEPYRSTVLYRYLDELSVAQVAERMSASEATVRKRLSRGLAQLRQRLEAEFGGGSQSWVRSLLFLLGRGPRTSTLRRETSAAVPVPWIAVAGGVSAAAFALGLAWSRLDVVDASSAVPTASVAPDAAGRSSLTQPSAGARVPVDEAHPLSSPLDTRERTVATLHGRVLSLVGEPGAGLDVRFVDEVSNTMRAGVESDVSGFFELVVPDARGRITAESAAFLSVFDSLVLGNGADGELNLVVAPRESIAGTVRDERGAPVAGADVELSLGSTVERVLDVTLDQGCLKEFSVRTDADGRFDMPDAPYVPDADLVVGRAGYRVLRARAGDCYGGDLELTLRGIESNPGVVSGTVRREDGTPAVDATVCWGALTVRANEQGRFQLDRSRRDSHAGLIAIDSGALPARAWLDPKEGPVRDLELVLGGPPPGVHGIVLAPDGTPAANVVVRIEAGSEAIFAERRTYGHRLFLPTTVEARMRADCEEPLETDANGRFELPVLPDRFYSLLAIDKGTLAAGRSRLVRGGHGTIEIRLPARDTARVRGCVTDVRGQPLEGVRVYPGQLDRTECGVTLPTYAWGDPTETDEVGAFDFPALVADDLVLYFWKGTRYVSSQRLLEPDADLEDLRIELPLRKHLRVCLPASVVVDSFALFDAQGQHLHLSRVYGDYTRRERRGLFSFGGSSPVYGVSERAAYADLYAHGKTLMRVPLRFDGLGVLRLVVP